MGFAGGRNLAEEKYTGSGITWPGKEAANPVPFTPATAVNYVHQKTLGGMANPGMLGLKATMSII